MEELVVNVVFHGVFAFALEPDYIDVMCPYFGPHDYRFGCAGELLPLGKGNYTIDGLVPIKNNKPSPDFDPQRIPFVKSLKGRNPQQLYAQLRVSYPEAINIFRDYSKNGEVLPFAGVHGAPLKLKAMAGPVVFRYHTKGFDGIHLLGTVLGKNVEIPFPRVIFSGPPKTLNLHFFAEGEHDVPCPCDADFKYQVGKHFQDAWDGLTGLIASLDLKLGRIVSFVEGKSLNPPIGNTALPGLPSVELMDLDELYKMDHKCPACGGAMGGIEDCPKAHVVVDNRATKGEIVEDPI